MNAVLLAAALFLVLLGVGFGMLFAQLLSRDRLLPLPDDWEEMFSPARYRAMERLLEEADYQYLASRSGNNKGLEKQLRFFFNDTAPTEIYTLSLHDALPIFLLRHLA